MVKKFALAAALMLAVAVPAKAMEVKIINHTQHTITDFWINGYHHNMNTDPFESQWTGGFSDNCGYHSLRALASDGTIWTDDADMCGDGIFNWHLRH